LDQTVIVRYGLMCNVGRFLLKNDSVKMLDKVIMRTDRGVEWGQAITVPEQRKEDDSRPLNGEVLRKAKEGDYIKQQKLDEETVPEELRSCKEMIERHNLPMRLVSVEHLYGGNKIIFYFLADGRVDFRRLVKDLAKQYQTRIEMRQIGVRDEARLLADFEHCGRELCCRTFIKNLEPVTMKMAKNQKATLDPSKISGRCGRLMCCLRFEDCIYEELKKDLPQRGSKVETPEGPGTVLDYDILKQTLLVDLVGGKRVNVSRSEVRRTGKRRKTREKK